jgi:hypothetical protein
MQGLLFEQLARVLTTASGTNQPTGGRYQTPAKARYAVRSHSRPPTLTFGWSITLAKFLMLAQ